MSIGTNASRRVRQRALWAYLSRPETKVPTIRQIMRALDYNSTATVHHDLCVLEYMGYVKFDFAKISTLRVVIPLVTA